MESLEERRVPSGYTVINMGSLGGTSGEVAAINDQGAVVGASFIAGNVIEHAFLFRHGVMTDLGTLGGTLSRAEGINDSGEVVGVSTTGPGFGQFSAFLYRHGHLSDLGFFDISKPFGNVQINDHGDVAGIPLADGDASLVRRGKVIDLGALAGLGSAARDLNNQDEVVGYSGIAQSGSGQVPNAFLYKDGRMIDLGTLGGSSSEAFAINNHGEVVGYSTTAGGDIHGFLYNRGRMSDLGTLGGPQSLAVAINDSGEVVGYSLTGADEQYGFLYEHGRMINLNSLIPAGAGFTIISAEGINNRGQIAANAISTNPGDDSAYLVLLNPQSRRH